jgi:alpha-tubulin suppressor-like RCC1 family protein
MLGCVARVGAGADCTCALDPEGALWCWGYNRYGQLGIGAFFDAPAPTRVAAFEGAVDDIAIGYKSCALVDGALSCWGYNFAGALGDGTTMTRDVPTPVSNLRDVAGMTNGSSHTCAWTTSGAAHCWGYNISGQVGDGTEEERHSPVPVLGLEAGVVSMTGGYDHTCALVEGGRVFCWGANHVGQLGVTDVAVESTTPLEVEALGTGITAVATSNDYTCALKADGSLWCWGTMIWSGTGNAVPQRIEALGNDVTSFDVGDWHVCAIRADGSLWCWAGSIPEPNPAVANMEPEEVTALGKDVISVSAGGYHTCAIRSGGSLWCWGRPIATGSQGHLTEPTQLTECD